MADAPTNTAGNKHFFDLTPAGRGNVVIDVEGVPDFPGRVRPVHVQATVVQCRSPARDTTLLPAAVDDEEWDQLKELSFEAGHIVALQFGGPDHPVNLAPMNKGANSASGLWGQIEQKMRHYVGNLAGGHPGGHLQVNLHLYYNSLEPRIPDQVFGSLVHVVGTAQTPVEWINHAISPPRERTDYVSKEVCDLFRDIEAASDAKGYDTLRRTHESPNAPLDVVDYKTDPLSIALRKRIRAAHPLLATYPVDGFRKGPGEKVKPEQRILLLLYNRYRNLKNKNIQSACLSAEDKQNLGFILREWQAQHDHTKPRANGGTNRYRNLVLTHHRANNLKGANGALRIRKRVSVKTRRLVF